MMTPPVGGVGGLGGCHRSPEWTAEPAWEVREDLQEKASELRLKRRRKGFRVSREHGSLHRRFVPSSRSYLWGRKRIH